MTNQLNRRNAFEKRLFQPAVVMAVSFSTAVIFALLMLPLSRFAGERRWYLLIYHAPVVVVFVSYLFDRLEHRDRISRWQWIVEALVVVAALIRAVFSIPYISGPALFLSYVIITTPFRLAWWLAVVVFVEVAYIKVFVLSDPTLVGGVIGGVLCGVAVLWGKRQCGQRT